MLIDLKKIFVHTIRYTLIGCINCLFLCYFFLVTCSTPTLPAIVASIEPSQRSNPSIICVRRDVDCNSARQLNAQTTPIKGNSRRHTIPNRPNNNVSLWSVIKKNLGSDLSKLPLPVNFNEPLSLLQRMVESFEYSHLLDDAAKCETVCDQLTFIAAFNVSTYSNTANRTGKPFNPMLGETYECDRRTELGWRFFAEQVSHHPAVSALHCESNDWLYYQDFSMKTSFRGKHIHMESPDYVYIEFKESHNIYRFVKIETSIHNIIIGKLWVDNHGEMEIVGISGPCKGHICRLSFAAHSYFSRDIPHHVHGTVIDSQGITKWILNGAWDQFFEASAVISSSAVSQRGLVGSFDNLAHSVQPYTTIWKRADQQLLPDEKYNFSLMACELNEEEDGVAPTDSRNRPDQRLMENGFWDEANVEKKRLEELQRTRQRENETAHRIHTPIWFTEKEVKNEFDDMRDTIWSFTQPYWECKAKSDWSRCPSIF